MHKFTEQVSAPSGNLGNFGDSGITAAISGRKIRLKLILALSLAIVCAGSAVYLSNAWFQAQFDAMRAAETDQPAPTTSSMRVVVAAKSLSYGTKLTPGVLKEIDWVSDAVPQGSFLSTADLMSGDGARVVLMPMAANEPILNNKITGPGQSASLSAMLQEGHKAVTIRVDDVLGVAGLVTTGDRVDVLWTKVQSSSSRPDQTYNEVLLSGVRVLALDQIVEEEGKAENSRAGYAKAVTIEVATLQAQKVALAASTGKLYLALQSTGDNSANKTRRVTMSDLSVRLKSRRSTPNQQTNTPATDQTVSRFSVSKRPAASTPKTDPDTPSGRLVMTEDYSIVGVTRGIERSEYSVPEAVKPF